MTQLLAQLSVRRGREAVEFYKEAFGAVEVYRVGGDSRNEAVVSQLSVGDSASFWVADESLVRPAVEEHGWRLGRIADPFGHHWEIGKPLRPWPPRH